MANIIKRNLKFTLVMAGLIGGIAITIYPIIIYPMMNIDEYKNIQKETRKGIRQEDIQPGNMKVWTDPFDRKK